MKAATETAPRTIIAPGRGGLLGTIRECWQHREILYFLAWRNVKVRYKQTVLGVLWALLQPLVTMLVFTLIFHKVGELKGCAGVPYPLFTLAGLLPWYLFQSALVQSSASLVTEARLLTKVYFPRLLVPLSSVLSALVDFVISFVILVGVTVYYCCLRADAYPGLRPGWGLLCVPAFVLLAMLAALSAGIWFAALSAKYRDFRYVVPFLVRVGLFLSPVGYSARELMEKTSLPQSWQWVYNLNPMTGVLEGFRWAFLGRADLDWQSVLVSLGVVLVVLGTGLLYFRRVERDFADML